MAKTVQTRLPAEMVQTIKEIKEYRKKKLEPTSNKSIVIDALKAFHKAVCQSANI